MPHILIEQWKGLGKVCGLYCWLALKITSSQSILHCLQQHDANLIILVNKCVQGSLNVKQKSLFLFRTAI